MVSDTVMDAGALRVDVEGSDAFCLIEEIRHRLGRYPHWHQNESETTYVIEGCFSC